MWRFCERARERKGKNEKGRTETTPGCESRRTSIGSRSAASAESRTRAAALISTCLVSYLYFILDFLLACRFPRFLLRLPVQSDEFLELRPDALIVRALPFKAQRLRRQVLRKRTVRATESLIVGCALAFTTKSEVLWTCRESRPSASRRGLPMSDASMRATRPRLVSHPIPSAPAPSLRLSLSPTPSQSPSCLFVWRCQ